MGGPQSQDEGGEQPDSQGDSSDEASVHSSSLSEDGTSVECGGILPRMTDLPQQPIEMILLRQLSEHLSIPMWVIDADGDLVFFNEAAEPTLGIRADDVDQMPFETWTESFRPRDEFNVPIAAEALPPVIAIRKGEPAHATLAITGGDGVSRRIRVTAFPLTGGHGEIMGSVTMFWESPEA
jgi:PAS domain-containing protein